MRMAASWAAAELTPAAAWLASNTAPGGGGRRRRRRVRDLVPCDQHVIAIGGVDEGGQGHARREAADLDQRHDLRFLDLVGRLAEDAHPQLHAHLGLLVDVDAGLVGLHDLGRAAGAGLAQDLVAGGGLARADGPDRDAEPDQEQKGPNKEEDPRVGTGDADADEQQAQHDVDDGGQPHGIGSLIQASRR
jgi:hypothetical protein